MRHILFLSGKQLEGAVYDPANKTQKIPAPSDNMRMEGKMQSETTSGGYKPSPMSPHRNVRRNGNESEFSVNEMLMHAKLNSFGNDEFGVCVSIPNIPSSSYSRQRWHGG